MAGKDYNIAKKTVQDEILEAVGGVAQQEDVQEILEKVEDIRAIQSENKQMLTVGNEYTGYTGTKTLLDITGSGALCLLYVNNLVAAASNKTAWVKITIDGQVYLYVTSKNTSSNDRSMGIAVFSIGFERRSSSGIAMNHLMCTNKIRPFTTINGFTDNVFSVGSGETTISEGTGSIGVEHAMPNPLRFEQSLKIEVYQTVNSIHYSEIIYYLD